MEGQLLWGLLILGVDRDGQDHLHITEVVLIDHDRGSLPQFLGVSRHDLLVIDREEGGVTLVHGKRIGPWRLVIPDELRLGCLQQVAPLSEGVQVVAMLGGTEGAFVQGDLTNSSQLADVEGELECGVHTVLRTIWSLHRG